MKVRSDARESHGEPADPASSILADLGACLWEADAQTHSVTYVSPHIEEVFGFHPECFLADREFFLSRLHPDDRILVERESAVAARGMAVEVEYRFLNARGEPRWCRDIARVVTKSDGSQCLRGVLVDITLRKKHEAWREATRRVLEMIAEGDRLTEVLETLVRSAEVQFPGMVCSVLLMDAEGRLRTGPAPSLPEDYRRGCDGIQPGPVAGSCGTAAFRRERVIVEDVMTDPLWVTFRALVEPLGFRSCWSEPIVSSCGEVLGTFATYRRTIGGPTREEVDFLESAASMARIALERDRAQVALRDSEEQLRQAQKMEAVGRLAGGVAHDFNNLLTAILGHAEILSRGLAEMDPRSTHARGVVAAATRGARLTRQLLAVSRKHVLVPKVFELNAVVGDVCVMLRRLIGEQIHLVVRLEPRTGRVKADVGQIEQVVINLALNARDAMPEGGKLVLATSHVTLDDEFVRKHPGARAGEFCAFSVTDEGVGMDETTRARIFEPFFTTKTEGRGTGLGLATVYGIVKQSGGNIWVESEPGKGATFWIYLPTAVAEERTVAPTSSPETTPHGRETVLLVEDQQDVREVLVRTLTDLGYAVLEARDGDEGLSLAAQHSGPIDLVVTDVVMPGTGGREMVKALSTLRPTTRILFISGYTESAVEQADLIEPGVEFLQKPFSPSDLARKVREVLDRRGSPERRGVLV